MSDIITSKNMPQKFKGADGGNSFYLGRKAYFNNISNSHLPETYKLSSKEHPKPISNKSSGLRTQRLRLTAIGSGSTNLKNNNDKITFKSVDNNFVNTLLTKARY